MRFVRHGVSLRSMTRAFAAVAFAFAFAAAAGAQTTVAGLVLIAESGEPAHDAEVVLLETDQVAHTDESGRFTFELTENLGAVTIHVDVGFLSAVRTFDVDVEEDTAFELPEPLLLEAGHRTHEHVTVTASASETSPFEAFGSVQSFEGLALQNEAARNLAELLEAAPGVAMRSFGPGSARPVLRGFDGDRVLIMEDGVRTGDLGSQSADHGVPVDPLQAERVEVVRGPATLLYGSNAIGGAVNVISMASHLAHSPPSGFRGQANLDYSTADEGIRGGVRAQTAGTGWFAWGGGNSNRTGDYDSPAGVVENSGGSMTQGEAGFGLFGERAWFSSSVRMDDSRYGVPFAGEFHGAHGHEEEEEGHAPEDEAEEHHEEEEGEHGEEAEELNVDVAMDRRQFRTDFGLRELGSVFQDAEFTVRYSDFEQDEIETVVGTTVDEVATSFQNRSLVVRGELKKPSGRVQSRLGVWGNFRNYQAAGEEALAPETDQTALAAFSYNEIQSSDRLSLLLGARIERNGYDAGERPEAGHGHEEEIEEHEHQEEEEGEEHHEEEEGHEDEHEPPPVMDRNFLAASASAGARLSLGEASTLVATASVFHPRSVARGALQLRPPHREPGLRDRESDPRSGEIARAGPESQAQLGAVHRERQSVPLRHLGFHLRGRHRRAGRRASGARVPAVRRRLSGFRGGRPHRPRRRGNRGERLLRGRDAERLRGLRAADSAAERPGEAGRSPWAGCSSSPRVRWAARMDRLYQGETATDGYAVFDFTASYVFVRHHTTSNVSFRAYNITDAEYRHHTSLIKDLAPQMGRGFRISYSLRFF